MADVRSISSSLVPSSTNDGDSLSALVIGIEMMKKYCRHLKYRKNIYLFTDGRGETDFDGYETILQQMIENNINLTVLGVDFDDEEFGFVEDPKEKGEIKRENERGWKAAVRIVDGVYGTMREAVEELEVPRIKPVRPQAVFRGKLTLGDPEIYESAITIDVERYPRTMVAKPPSASRVVEGPVGGEEGEVKTETQLEDRGSKEFQGVKNAFSYKVKDENAPTGTVDVERAQLDKGYKYGRTIVPIAESDLEVVNLATKAGMEIVSFFETRRVSLIFRSVKREEWTETNKNDSINASSTCRKHASQFISEEIIKPQWRCHRSSMLCTNWTVTRSSASSKRITSRQRCSSSPPPSSLNSKASSTWSSLSTKTFDPTNSPLSTLSKPPPEKRSTNTASSPPPP